jgi:hypothetical protein
MGTSFSPKTSEIGPELYPGIAAELREKVNAWYLIVYNLYLDGIADSVLRKTRTEAGRAV